MEKNSAKVTARAALTELRERGTETRTVDLERVVEDPELQTRDKTYRMTVDKYADALRRGETLPPVMVVPMVYWDAKARALVVSGDFLLLDGWHRTEATKDAQYGRIEARVRWDLAGADRATLRDTAANENTKNGRPLNAQEKRNRLRAFIEAGRYRVRDGRKWRVMSYREMASELNGILTKNPIKRLVSEEYPDVHRKIMGGRIEGMIGEFQLDQDQMMGLLKAQRDRHLLRAAKAGIKQAIDALGKADDLIEMKKELGPLIWALGKALNDPEGKAPRLPDRHGPKAGHLAAGDDF